MLKILLRQSKFFWTVPQDVLLQGVVLAHLACANHHVVRSELSRSTSHQQQGRTIRTDVLAIEQAVKV